MKTINFLLFFLTTLLFVSAMENVGYAGVMLRWSPTSASSSGSPINVDLFLEDSDANSDLSLYGAAGVSYVVNLSGVGTISSAIANPGFEGPFDDGSGNLIPKVTYLGPFSVSIEQTSIFGLTASSGSLLVGSFTINPSITGSGSLSVALFGSGADFGIYDSNYGVTVFDDRLFNCPLNPPPTFEYRFDQAQTSIVPEPTALLVNALLFGFVLVIRFQQRIPRSTPSTGH
jgi:hypothetical protein